MNATYIARMTPEGSIQSADLYDEPLTFEEIEQTLRDAGIETIEWNASRTAARASGTVGGEPVTEIVELIPSEKVF